jgi:hypothetical protein
MSVVTRAHLNPMSLYWSLCPVNLTRFQHEIVVAAIKLQPFDTSPKVLRKTTINVNHANRLTMTVFWDVTQCGLVDTDRRFRVAYCLHHKTDAVSSTETSVNIYQTTRCNVAEDSHLYTRRHENVKPHQANKLLILLLLLLYQWG